MSGADAKSEDVALADEKTFSTFMIRNLPPSMTQHCLMKELAKSGFDNAYNFLYMPQAFNAQEKKCVKGFAFVNFSSPSVAESFVEQWHGRHLSSMSQSQPALNISPAAVQGLEQNLKKWATHRLRRIRNPHLRPFVRDGDAKELQKVVEAPPINQAKERVQCTHTESVERCQQKFELDPRSRLSDAIRRAEVFVKQARRSNIRETVTAAKPGLQ
jgi:hypothetical protein